MQVPKDCVGVAVYAKSVGLGVWAAGYTVVVIPILSIQYIEGSYYTMRWLVRALDPVPQAKADVVYLAYSLLATVRERIECSELYAVWSLWRGQLVIEGSGPESSLGLPRQC